MKINLTRRVRTVDDEGNGVTRLVFSVECADQDVINRFEAAIKKAMADPEPEEEHRHLGFEVNHEEVEDEDA